MHFELAARDRARLTGFYAHLFGWQQTEYPGVNYTILQTTNDRGINGGMSEAEAIHTGVVIYVEVDDVDCALSTAVELGATSIKLPHDVGLGRFAIFADPEGNRMGIMKLGRQTTYAAGGLVACSTIEPRTD